MYGYRSIIHSRKSVRLCDKGEMIVGFENEFIDDIIFWAMVIFGGFLVLILLDILGGLFSDKK